MSHIEKHIIFLDMLQRGELLRSEVIREAIIELYLNKTEGQC